MNDYNELLLLKCGELVLKGLNRRVFEMRLLSNVRYRLGKIGQFRVHSVQSTVYVRPADDEAAARLDEALESMTLVYGVVSLCKAFECEKSLEAVLKAVPLCCRDELARVGSFKAEVRRSDKSFPLTSPQLAAEVGGAVLDAFPELKVNLDAPELTVYVEIREDAAYIHAGRRSGAGGMPVGTSGKALLMLSGGIDSPVAGEMIAKRGAELFALHFASPPYTSPRALQKVQDLAEAMRARCGEFELGVVNVAPLMETLRDTCPEDLFTLLLRRFMMRIACRIAEKRGCGAVITGESLGQVASQTMEALEMTDAVADRPVFRPCIGLDKEEIITLARKYGTMEISAEPYEDCCTVFTPRHPQTHPRPREIAAAELPLDIESLTDAAIQTLELYR